MQDVRHWQILFLKSIFITIVTFFYILLRYFTLSHTFSAASKSTNEVILTHWSENHYRSPCPRLHHHMVWLLDMLALLQIGDITHVPINCSIEGRIPAEKGQVRKLDGLKCDCVFVCVCVSVSVLLCVPRSGRQRVSRTSGGDVLNSFNTIYREKINF